MRNQMLCRLVALVVVLVLPSPALAQAREGLESGRELPLAVAASAGMGALLGAGIDSGFSRSPRVVYRLRF
jgi:hypothetical protein